MSNELYFLVSAVAPPETDIEIGSLMEMKIESELTSWPHVAFATEELGHQFIAGRKMESYFCLRQFSKLAPEQMEKAQIQSVILFDRAEQVAQYLEDSEHFASITHPVALEVAQGKLKNAL